MGEDSDSGSVTCYLLGDFRQAAWFLKPHCLTDERAVMISTGRLLEYRSSDSHKVPSTLVDTGELLWTQDHVSLKLLPFALEHTAFPH